MTIIAFKPRPKPPAMIEVPINQTTQPVMDMIMQLTQWAYDMGVNTESTDFKYEAATIMTVLQGMVHRVK